MQLVPIPTRDNTGPYAAEIQTLLKADPGQAGQIPWSEKDEDGALTVRLLRRSAPDDKSVRVAIDVESKTVTFWMVEKIKRSRD